MIFTIGVLLIIIAAVVAAIKGSTKWQPANNWDGLAGLIGLIGFIAMCFSVLSVIWKYMP